MELEESQLLGEEVGVEVEHGGVDDGQVVDVGAEGGLNIVPIPARLKTSNLKNDEVGQLVKGERIGIGFQPLYVVEYHCLHLMSEKVLEFENIWTT